MLELFHPRIRLVSAILVSTCAVSSAIADPAMRYDFKANPHPVYAVTIHAELPEYTETQEGHISYDIAPPDPDNGQIRFNCTVQLQSHMEKDSAAETINSNPFARIPIFTGGNERGTLIDSLGKVLRTHRGGIDQQLPFMLGSFGGLLIQPLSADNQDSWKIDGPITLYEKKQQTGFPHPFMFGQQEEVTEDSAHQTITFTRKDASGSAITIERQIDLATDEKVGDTPVEHLTGDGQFVFDTDAGLIRSLDLKQTIEVNQKNVSAKVPVTVIARLLTEEQYKQWQTDQAAVDAKQKIDNQKAQERFAAQRAQALSDSLPDGATKTAIVGADGGSPYTRVNADGKPVIGFSLTLGHWSHVCIGSAIPLFDKPTGPISDDETVYLAKDGYVVGGVIVNSLEGADGLRIIFMKKTDKGVDPKTSYKSPWFGYRGTGTKTQLDGNGKLIIGTYGYQGMNLNKIGLVIAGSDANKAKDEDN